ncbi:MAG: hypothetical protein SPE82_06800 [Succinivibrio sp.]|nr:hypothetical protein [Succinivibrio sp.]
MAELSSINIEPSKINNTEHNTRFVSPTYLLKEKSLGVEYDLNHEEAEALYQSLLNEAVDNYVQRTGQQLQAKKLRWSAVVNIKDTTTMDDLKKLTQKLYQEYGWQCYQIAIHRDEGHKDPDTGETIYNLHAHLEFLMLNKKGIYCFKKGEWGKGKMSKLQDLVAEQLQMKRGETLNDRIKNIAELLSADISEILRGKDETYTAYCKRLNLIAGQKGIENFNAGSFLKGKTRVNHYQYKQQMKAVEDAYKMQKEKDLQEKARELAQKDFVFDVVQKEFIKHKKEQEQNILTLKEQKAIVEAERKKYKDEADHIASEYRALQALNKTLHTREELDKALAALRKDYEDRLAKEAEKINTLNSTVKKLQDKNEELKADISTLQASEQKLKAQNTLAANEYEQQKNVFNVKIAEKDKKIKEIIAKLAEKPKTREYTLEEIEKLPRVVDLKTIIKDLKAKLELKPKEIVKTVKQELSEDDIEQLPRVKELCNKVKQLTDDNTILKTKLKEKPKEVRVEVPTIKTVTVQRELTNEELTNLPIVRELSLDNEQLRNENAQLSKQIEEHQEGLALLVGRIDDEGFPEIADSIAQSGQSGSIREIYEKIADFFSSTLKRSVQKVVKTVGNAFKFGR